MYFMDGFSEGVKRGLSMAGVGVGLMKTKRLNPLGFFSSGGIKGKNDLQKILAKAREIEDQRKGLS